MKVYVACQYSEVIDGPAVLGVFSTQEGAKRRLLEQISHDEAEQEDEDAELSDWYYEQLSYGIQAWEVDAESAHIEFIPVEKGA